MPSNPTWAVGARSAKRGQFGNSSGVCVRGLVRWGIMAFVGICVLSVGFFTYKMHSQKLTSSQSDEYGDLAEFVHRAHVPAGNRQARRRTQTHTEEGDAAANRGLRAVQPATRPRRIILSDGEGKWNTGVWPGWGEDPRYSVLKWAAAGVRVEKSCPYTCVWTRDQDVSKADAVVMELVNHPKFGFSKQVPIPWPAKRPNPRAQGAGPKPTAISASLPITGVFYYEAAGSYPDYTLMSANVRDNIDFSVTPSSQSTLPIGMVCPWGRAVADYVKAPPQKTPGHLIAYFNEHGIHKSYLPFVDELFRLAGGSLHSYIHKRNRDMPPEAGGDPYSLSRRLDFLGTYKFVLVTEAVVEEDWIEPDLSQVFLAGSVPIYLGAPNVHAFIPGPRSFVHAREFKSGSDLWEFIRSFEDNTPENEARYNEFFAWKPVAQRTMESDEESNSPAIGTGEGLSNEVVVLDELTEDLRRWDAKPKEAPGAQHGEVLSLAEQQKWLAGGRSFDAVATYAWRNFRRQLDRCVHYAECRICELVTLLTPD